MPTGRELNRLKSENRRLREELEAAQAKPGALERRLQELREELSAADGRVATTVRLMNEMVTNHQADRDKLAEAEEVLALRYEDWTATVAAEMGRREGAMRADHASFIASLEETLEDLDGTEARLNELWTRIQERGRRKEVQSVHADMNRAVLGCSRSRLAIQEKLAELQARQPKEEGRRFITTRMSGQEPALYPTEQLRHRVEGSTIVLSPLHAEDLTGEVKGLDFEPRVLPIEGG